MKCTETIYGPEDAQAAKEQELANTQVWYRDSRLQAEILERRVEQKILLDRIEVGTPSPYVFIIWAQEVRFPYIIAQIWSRE